MRVASPVWDARNGCGGANSGADFERCKVVIALESFWGGSRRGLAGEYIIERGTELQWRRFIQNGFRDAQGPAACLDQTAPVARIPPLRPRRRSAETHSGLPLVWYLLRVSDSIHRQAERSQGIVRVLWISLEMSMVRTCYQVLNVRCVTGVRE